MLTAVGDRVTFTASKVGTPMITRTTVPDDKILVGYARSAPPGSRWCGIDLHKGSVVRYAPGVEHTSPPQPGLDYMFAITDCDELALHADVLGIPLRTPPRGEVSDLRPSATTALAQEAFEAFADLAASGNYPPTPVEDDVLHALVHLVADDDAAKRAGGRKRIDPRRIVHTCIDYAESMDRIPSISELCLVAHVSDRCLRLAFIEQFDTSPTRYFRAWALDQAHRRLRHADAHDLTVTDVATGLGWNHLGRFALRYRQIYGQTPSNTLRAPTR